MCAEGGFSQIQSHKGISKLGKTCDFWFPTVCVGLNIPCKYFYTALVKLIYKNFLLQKTFWYNHMSTLIKRLQGCKILSYMNTYMSEVSNKISVTTNLHIHLH